MSDEKVVAAAVEPRLKEWDNADEVGHRFRPSVYACPQCGGATLADDWPPNYFQGGAYTVAGQFIDESSGAIKHVCLHCRIAFIVTWKRKSTISGLVGDEPKVEKEHACTNIEPLVVDGEWLLTPHDVWREQFRKANGKYPHEVYG